MCELLAQEIDTDKDTCFLVGLFSGLDTILDKPLEQALQPLPLSSCVTQAILHKTGVAGEALQYALDYERWEVDKPIFYNIEPQRIATIYLECIQWWANEVYPFIR